MGGQPGHRGTTLVRVARPDRVVTHAPQSCRRCAAVLSDGTVTAIERRQVFELLPVWVEVTEHRAETRRCAACGERTKAEFPREVRAPVQYGEGVRARATYLHKYHLLPFARTAEAMRELFGCAFSPVTLHTIRRRCAAKLVGVEARIKAALRSAPVIRADETGLRVGPRGMHRAPCMLTKDRLMRICVLNRVPRTLGQQGIGDARKRLRLQRACALGQFPMIDL